MIVELSNEARDLVREESFIIFSDTEKLSKLIEREEFCDELADHIESIVIKKGVQSFDYKELFKLIKHRIISSYTKEVFTRLWVTSLYFYNKKWYIK
jgi:hypothetical protein